MVPIMDSVFGGCTCGAPNVNGIPCHHMISVVKSSRVEGLTATNAMPSWWSTKTRRNQYSQEAKCASINMSTLTTNHTADQSWRYCPPYIAPQKSGRPKIAKRFKSPLEQMKQKKEKVSVQKQMENESKSQQRQQGHKIKAKRERNRTECQRWLLAQRWIFGHLVIMY